MLAIGVGDGVDVVAAVVVPMNAIRKSREYSIVALFVDLARSQPNGSVREGLKNGQKGRVSANLPDALLESTLLLTDLSKGRLCRRELEMSCLEKEKASSVASAVRTTPEFPVKVLDENHTFTVPTISTRILIKGLLTPSISNTMNGSVDGKVKTRRKMRNTILRIERSPRMANRLKRSLTNLE